MRHALGRLEMFPIFNHFMGRGIFCTTLERISRRPIPTCYPLHRNCMCRNMVSWSGTSVTPEHVPYITCYASSRTNPSHYIQLQFLQNVSHYMYIHNYSFSRKCPTDHNSTCSYTYTLPPEHDPRTQLQFLQSIPVSLHVHNWLVQRMHGLNVLVGRG